MREMLAPAALVCARDISLIQTLGFDVRAFDCTVRAAADCAEAYAVLKRYVFPSLPRTDIKPAQPEISIHMVQSADGFQLLVDDVHVTSASQPVALVPHLIHALDEAVVQHLTTLRAVHAGAVLCGGRALLLPGKTHSGKSSLVAELLRRGATYFSDEYALIDAEGRVHPYPRPLLLRNDRDEQFPSLPDQFGAAVGNAPAPVGWILSLEYHPGGAWSIAQVPQSLALLGLLRNTPHTLPDSPQMVGAFQSAVAGASCFEGRRGEAGEAAEHILQMIGDPA
jgi:hypothetical protein